MKATGVALLGDIGSGLLSVEVRVRNVAIRRFDLTHEESVLMRAALQEQKDAASASECTGLSARWCPLHGDCICKGDNLNEYACPLHGFKSDHQEENEQEASR